jgi:hypothetical protein
LATVSTTDTSYEFMNNHIVGIPTFVRSLFFEYCNNPSAQQTKQKLEILKRKNCDVPS